MDPPQRFCVRWNSYKSNLQTAFPKLLTSEHFVDVTLACEKQFIKCHKIVLSACSVYFETLLVNNPCQHPIIFMKDVEFWEIKALVEFMYKGEVNVSQNQLDSLLKSAESLQIRGLSGTKQFANFDQSEESREDCISDGKTKRNKHDSEEEGQEEVSRKKRKKGDDDDKYIQITSVQQDDSSKSKTSDDNDNDENQVIKQESIEIEDYQFDNSEMGAGDDGDEDECYHRGAFRTGRNISSDMAGPSGISDICSLALNNVECVMDQEKAKSEVNPDRSSIKCQVRHQEHNYTNPPKEEAQKTTTVPKEEAANYQTRSSSSSGDSSRSKNSSVKVSSHSRSETNSTRQTSQPSSSVRNLSVEVKSRVIKKDVFNRIRRSEEELQKAAEMVRGGMTFQTASDTFNIPISTIRFYMARRGILPQRRRGRGSSGVRDDDLIHPPFEIIHYRLPDIDKPV